ncbi:MAG TPA: methionine--tRNA ligase [Xanthobacteraceae bacterium]|nr:methionine--tRNA ligase [Xanthobacteraceae bacterium]
MAVRSKRKSKAKSATRRKTALKRKAAPKKAASKRKTAGNRKAASKRKASAKRKAAPKRQSVAKATAAASHRPRPSRSPDSPRAKAGQGGAQDHAAPLQPHVGAERKPTLAGTAQAQSETTVEPGSRPRYYLTTAIAYPNGVPHIGHAYEAIATDAIARFMRLDGRDVFFLTGTDEHGVKMLQTAAKEGVSPRELADRNVELFRKMVQRMNCSNDDYIRTTEPRHYRSSAAIWERMVEAGDIYLSKYSGWYSVRDEAYYDVSETRLDEQGQRIGPQGTPVDWVEEESYFFRLSAYQDKLLELYARVPDFVLPRERLNEVASFVRGGLKDLSVSRTTFSWGIPVPGDDKHVMYVWVDALTNYITAVGFPDTDSEQFRRYWPADLHVIGKDIVRFHAVYWPAFLMSAGIAVPRRIFSHGFLFNRGEKMSKSVGNVIDPFALADAYGVDPLRYFFLREVPFGQDGNYSHEAIVARINADLANDLGNLAQRSLTMVARNFAGVLPAPAAFSPNDEAILGLADGMLGKAREAMKTQALHQVLNTIWAVVAEANRYFAGEAPWALAKTDPVRQGTVLYVTAEVLRQIAILIQPFMPESAGKLLDLLAIHPGAREFSTLGAGQRIPFARHLPAPAPVFPRYVEPPTDKPS